MTRARTVSVAAALVSLGIGLYLSWLRARGEVAPCIAGSHGCATVAASAYSRLVGVPVSVLGAVAAGTVLGLAAIEGAVVRAAGATIAFAGCAYSVYLTWLELGEIDAVCQWCVVSAAAWTVLAASEGMRLRQVASSS